MASRRAHARRRRPTRWRRTTQTRIGVGWWFSFVVRRRLLVGWLGDGYFVVGVCCCCGWEEQAGSGMELELRVRNRNAGEQSECVKIEDCHYCVDGSRGLQRSSGSYTHLDTIGDNLIIGI